MRAVTVIIPNYNGIKYIRDCLDALMHQTMEADILVVDNASADGSCEMVKEYENVTLITLDENYGFSRAVNVGIKAARTEYVLLLNNDTKAEPAFVENMYKAIASHPDTFSVSARMMQMNAPDRIDSAGDLYCALGWAFSLGKDKSGGYEKSACIFSACAGAAIYRRELFEKIGYFDELHFSYLEDVDIGYRARLAGYKNRYTPDAVVYHAGSATTGGRYNPFKIKLVAGNSIYIIYKNMPALQILINLPFLLAGFCVKVLFFAAKGYGGVYLAGLGRGFGLCKKASRVKTDPKRTGRYCRIQLELWLNMFRRFIG